MGCDRFPELDADGQQNLGVPPQAALLACRTSENAAELYRTIPLTDRAYEILKEIKDKRPWQKESSLLSQTLEYIDRRTGAISRLVMRDLVFINWRTGEPAKNSSYDTHLYKLCDEAGIENSVCTLYAIPTPQERLNAAYSPKCCKSCLVTQV